MPADPTGRGRVIKAVHGVRPHEDDPAYEVGLAEALRAKYDTAALMELYARFSASEAAFDAMMRRILVRAAARGCGHGLQVGPNVGFKHVERLSFGDRVFLGAQAYIQGRFDGRCEIGNHVWIGPQAYFDARDLVIEDHVGWGPGAKVLGSAHTGVPIDVPIVATDLVIKPVRIGARADVGTGAIVLPGVTVGHDSIVGAGAVVAEDVPPYAVVAGVPARFLKWRDGSDAVRGNI